MIEVREAKLKDVEQIRELFQVAYGETYFYPQYYDVEELSRMVYDNDTIFLVAVDTKQQKFVAGPHRSSSVCQPTTIWSENLDDWWFTPIFDKRGIGKQLMNGRLERVKERLHLGVVENRATHTFSQRISTRQWICSRWFYSHEVFRTAPRIGRVLCSFLW